MKNLLFFLLLSASLFVNGQSHLYDPEPKSEAIKSIAKHYIDKNNSALEKELKELHDKNTWTKAELTYAKTVLLNLPKNSRLITNGITDTYPILYLQTVEKYRSDVKLIPLTFFQYQTYREGFIEYKNNPNRFQGIDANLMTYLFTNKLFTPIHVSNSVPKELFEQHISNLYPIGLTFRYSATSFKNSVENAGNWEKNQQALQALNQSESGKKLSPNFLPMLMNLYVYFQSQNNIIEKNKVKESIDSIGKNIQNEQLFKALGLTE